jgi:hypothetical protein
MALAGAEAGARKFGEGHTHIAGGAINKVLIGHPNDPKSTRNLQSSFFTRWFRGCMPRSGSHLRAHQYGKLRTYVKLTPGFAAKASGAP